jgi:hypothetical protein
MEGIGFVEVIALDGTRLDLDEQLRAGGLAVVEEDAAISMADGFRQALEAGFVSAADDTNRPLL